MHTMKFENKTILVKKTIALLFCALTFSFINAQTDNSGTIKIQKSKCLDFNLKLTLTKSRDTITISEVNKSFGFMPYLVNCLEQQEASIEFYDLSINGASPIHLTTNVVPYYSFKIQEKGTITITNCVLRVVRPNQKDNTIILPTQTFYIIADSK